MICKICNKKFKNLRSLSNHLVVHKMSSKQYYDKFLKAPYEEYCQNPYCISEYENRPKYAKIRGIAGYSMFCGKKCMYFYLSTSKDINNKRHTSMKKAWLKSIKLNRKERGIKISKSLKGKTFNIEHRTNISLSLLGNTPWNKNKKLSDFHVKNLKISHRRTIEDIKNQYPFFSKIEEMRYNPNKPLKEKEIQVHCKNNNCKNSKEKGGWFTPKYDQFAARLFALEKSDGNDGHYIYCSQHCKDTCPLYNVHGDPYKDTNKPYTSAELKVFNKHILKRDDEICYYCKKHHATIVHHLRPQKLEPFFALDPDYAISVCAKCHYKYGHPTGSEHSTGNLAKIVCSVESQKFLNQK